jgi:DNA repair protein RecN (Recombination protein N)
MVAEIHARSLETLGELQSELSRYTDKIEIEPARLHELEERINLLQSLRRKYGSAVADVIAFSEEARRKLLALEQRDTEVDRLNGALASPDQSCRQGAERVGVQTKSL